jgi:hypothetical protein
VTFLEEELPGGSPRVRLLDGMRLLSGERFRDLKSDGFLNTL